MQFCKVYTGHLNKGNEINPWNPSQEKWPSANVPFEKGKKKIKRLENYKQLRGAGTAVLFWTRGKPEDVTQARQSEVDRLTVSTAARVLNSDCIQCCDHRAVSNCTASAGARTSPFWRLSGAEKPKSSCSPVTCPSDTRAPHGPPQPLWAFHRFSFWFPVSTDF